MNKRRLLIILSPSLVLIFALIVIVYFLVQSKKDSQKSAQGQQNPIAECSSTPSRGEFGNEQLVDIQGYNGDAMEVGVSPDEKYLFFNDNVSNSPQKDLHWAEFAAGKFVYKGKLQGVNSSAVDSSPEMDSAENFYFTTLVNYGESRSTTLRKAKFENGSVKDLQTISGNIYVNKVRWVSLDPDTTADGGTLVFSEGFFDNSPPSVMNLRLAHRENGGGYTLDPNQDLILRNINTDKLEFAPAISANSLELFFTRMDKSKNNLDEKFSIMVARRSSLNETFCLPEKVGTINGYVEAPTLSGDEKTLYYHKLSDGKFRIFKVTRDLAN